MGEDQMRLSIYNVTFAGKPLAEMSITEIRDAQEYLAKRIQTLQWLTRLVIDHHPSHGPLSQPVSVVGPV
jgi:hypothetical protein